MKSHRVPDELDRRILAELQRDARQSMRAVARAVRSTTPTVAARVRRMEDIGLILGYTVRLSRPSAAASKPAAWTCVQCGGPVRGTARVRRLTGRHYAFCCAGCEQAFVARLVKLQAAPGAG